MKLYFIYPEWCREMFNYSLYTGKIVMKRMAIILLAVIILVGCNNSNQSKQTSSDNKFIPREQAKKILWDLPEVMQWSNEVRRKYHGKVVPVCTGERTPK